LAAQVPKIEFLSSKEVSSVPFPLSVDISATFFTGITSDISLSIYDIVVARFSISGVASLALASVVSSASAGTIVFSAEAGGGVYLLACLTFIIHHFF
jgi:hypothetical protein